MKKLSKLQAQKGFTLVELAIVLVIIGLLIGGILKGQQLIDNARVTAQMTQFQGLQAAETSFQDAYAGLPGDITTPNTRVPNTPAACSIVATNGDGKVGAVATHTTLYSVGGSKPENVCFFAELSGAGYLAGISTPGTIPSFGQSLPQAKLGAGLIVADVQDAPSWSGLYVVDLQSTADPTTVAGTNSMTPGQAAQIDRKMDDGNPVTGSVIGVGAASCTTNPYTEATTTNDCDVGYKLQ